MHAKYDPSDYQHQWARTQRELANGTYQKPQVTPVTDEPVGQRPRNDAEIVAQHFGTDPADVSSFASKLGHSLGGFFGTGMMTKSFVNDQDLI